MNDLMLSTLRAANAQRVGQFKNNLGEPAHRKPDGSDWNFGMWLEAVLGEMGEVCKERIDLEDGIVSHEHYAEEVRKEFADVQTYLDLWAMRALDVNEFGLQDDHGLRTIRIMATLGMYFEARKKLNRGDISYGQFEEKARPMILHAVSMIASLLDSADTMNREVVLPHPKGIDLGQATTDKFNQVSERVGSNVRI